MKNQIVWARWAGAVVVAVWGVSVLAQTAATQASNTTATPASQPIIEAVTGSLQSGAEVVKIDLSQPLTAIPNGFSIKSPAKIALDIPGVGNAMGRSTIEVNQGNLRSVNLIPAGDRTRVVLNLNQATNYKAELQGKSLLLTLDPVAATMAPTAPAPTFAESKSRETLPIKDLDFRRGVSGSGRVVVALPNNQVGVDIRQSGQTLVVEFMKSSLPEGLRRKLDVTDFGTPVQTVTAFQVGDRVRMVIEPKGAWEHSAYQSDDQFVVEVKSLRVDPAKLTQGPGYNGQKLSLNFQNIEIRALLQVIADFTNFNVVTSDSVAGNVTLRLQDVPWDQALDIILQSKGLGLRKNGNVLWIAPKDEILAKEKLEREANAALETLEPVRTQSFQLNYAKAVDVARQLSGAGAVGAGAGAVVSARILSPRGSAIAEPRTNQLFVTDIGSKLEQVQDLIAKLDIAVRQVLIEARIVEASDTFGKSLGVRLGGGIDQITSTSGRGVDFGPTYNAASAGTTNGTFVNLPAGGQGGFNASTFAVSIFGENAARFLNLEISALEADGKGKVVSSPRVVTADKVKAVIEQGTELPYQIASASGATSIAFRKANLMLEVTPQITPEGNVILELDINKDTVGQSTPAGFAIDTKHVKTQVLVENGGTVVIGGIFTQAEAEDTAKVPFFGDLPGLGVLFRNKVKRSEKREMLVFITPKALTDRTSLR
ncbi:type IV pilus secretin PilQ [Rhodoferax sp. BAB1]|uniref:type IV pilus secretin PilQ n=1 Tax=Rhodoferax sp. BAB1 TaxID=2741720 RepID=UPI0015766F7C|nr:type IV pilus secretin PilQ [Rhodoferax sp. BAB1]QKO22842.1 type IV pilus secretin PilQ [Rhodoferax sp. BAB1]